MIFLVFSGYLVVLLLIGILCMKKNQDLGDFVLGGRRIGPWVTSISAQASDMSSWLLIGLPGVAYASGFSIIWTVAGCAAGTVFNWLVVAPRLRKLAGEYNCLTVPDILEARLSNGKNPAIRIVSVLIIILFYTSYIAAQFIAAGKVFETTFKNLETPFGTFTITYNTGLILGGGVIIAYTMLGGFLAVAYTDVLQGILMLIGVIMLPLIAIFSLPEGTDLFESLKAARGSGFLSVFGNNTGGSLIFGVIIGGLSWGLGYPGQPHILSRFMAIRQQKELKRAALIGISWVILALSGAFFLGIIGVEVIGNHIPDQDKIMPLMAHRLLPPFLEGLLISAAVAAMMSTVDSQMIIAVGSFERDILDKLLGVKLSGAMNVLLGRIITFLIGTAGILMALSKENVFDKVLDAWGGLAAGLGPAVLLTLLWKRSHRIGIISGMITGIIVVEFRKFIELPLFFNSIGALESGFFLNLIIAIIISLCLNRNTSKK